MDQQTAPQRTRHRAKAQRKMDIVYEVLWHPERKGFCVQRCGTRMDVIVSDRMKAIALAVEGARREAQAGLKVIVYSILDERRKAEWSN